MKIKAEYIGYTRMNPFYKQYFGYLKRRATKETLVRMYMNLRGNGGTAAPFSFRYPFASFPEYPTFLIRGEYGLDYAIYDEFGKPYRACSHNR